PIVIDAEVFERPPHNLGQAQIADDVVEQPADQKLERKVIDTLATSGEALAVRRQPTVNDPVAQRHGGCKEPIPAGSGGRILADGGRELGQHGGFELLDVVLGGWLVGDGDWSSRLVRNPLALFRHKAITQDSCDAPVAEDPTHRLALGFRCSKPLSPAVAKHAAAQSRGRVDVPPTPNRVRRNSSKLRNEENSVNLLARIGAETFPSVSGRRLPEGPFRAGFAARSPPPRDCLFQQP